MKLYGIKGQKWGVRRYQNPMMNVEEYRKYSKNPIEG